ncbi:hypothetical protein KQI68_07080 [Peptoniphilus sp. MSJ-1]|uniref:Uncharacterized protein n=1 Tax=Peptoniphilus ovalis TaxID=2841503 RepID=A0ABS6FK06_9FIRM|nr:hypothetical protein [Peptoniphilus ovalis]MBU5669601.1 hypothetical protein [Peptoniphilus ovalis]
MKHYLVIETLDTKVVYHTTIFKENCFADEEFYRNLKLKIDLDNQRLKRTEIKLENFIIEWFRFLSKVVSPDVVKVLLEVDFDDLKIAPILYMQLINNRQKPLNQFYIVFDYLLGYAKKENPAELEDKYKLYIEVF